MKSKKAVFKSFRKKILYKPGADILQPNIRHGETLIPTGATATVIHLPKTKQTFTYDIINTDRLTSDVTVATTEGSLVGLILNTDGGSLNITPVAAGTKQLKFKDTIKDGSYISTLSDGADWFIWSIGTGAGLGQSTTQRKTNAPPSIGLIGGSIGSTFQSVVPAPVYADLVVTRVDATVDYPSGPAEHDLVFHGTAEPNSTIKVFDSVPAQVGTVSVASDGAWSFSVNDLANGQHEYEFKAFVGGSEINKNDFWSNLLNGSSLEFECAEIQIEVGTSGPDFTVLPTITDPNGASITPTVNSTTYSNSLTEDQTFNVIFDFVYDSVTYQRTVQGIVVNLIQPAVPAITSVGGNASGVAISATTANIVGTAAIGATVEVWIDGVPNQAIATVTADGSGDWSISSHDFGFTMNQTVIIKAQQQTTGGSLWSNATDDFLVVYEQNVLAEPTVTANTFSNGDYTNQANPFTISGTGVDGAEITLNGATPLGGTITVAGGAWSTTVNLSHDAVHNITAQATKATFVGSQQSTAFQLNVDRTAPSFGPIYDTTLYLGNVNDSIPTATDAFDPNGVTVTPSYTPALTSAEGPYVASYTATDRAGNSTTATDARTITVTTQPIIPVITNVTANVNGTFTIAGTVTGTYADNLTVQITIDDSNSGSPVNVVGGAFTHITSAQSPGTYAFKAKTINNVADESSLSSAQSASIAVPDTTPPVITVTNDLDDSQISNSSTVTIEVGQNFTFTATASDDPGNINLSNSITEVTNDIDTTTAGNYTVELSVTDGTNETTFSFTVTVVTADNFVEDIPSVVARAGSQISNGILDINDPRGGANGGFAVRLDTDGILQYASGDPVNDEFTISWWMKPDLTQDHSGLGIIGAKPSVARKFDLRLSNGITAPRYVIGIGTRVVNHNTPQSTIGDGNWHHFAITCEADSAGENLVTRLYVDGSFISSTGGFANIQGNNPPGTKLLPPSSNDAFYFGTSLGGTKSIKAEFNSIQFGDGVVLSAVQIAAIHAQSDQGMSIATASGL